MAENDYFIHLPIPTTVFNKINFRYTDAQSELAHSPEILTHAFVEIENVTQEVLMPDRYIVYGPKGSGKTALASRLGLQAEGKWDSFVETDDLEHFEYRLIARGGLPGYSVGGPFAVWKSLLLLRLFEIFSKDELLCERNPHMVRFIEDLKSYGFVGSKDLTAIAQQTARQGAFAKLKTAVAEAQLDHSLEFKREKKDAAGLYDALCHILHSLIRADGMYLLLLDGLDYPLRRGKTNVWILADLLAAVKQVNEVLQAARLKAKVIILIRTEILKLLPDSNLAKKVNDHGIQLRWYDNVREPLRSGLVSVIHKRAQLAGYTGSAEVMIAEWLPRTVRHREVLKLILDNTRHLPRDLISIFRALQELGKEPPFSEMDVLAALKNYSEWFFDELGDSLVGLLPEDVRGALQSVVGRLDRRFSFQEFEALLRQHGLTEQLTAEEISRELFNTGWIGNVWQTPRGSDRYSWFHRNPRASFDPSKTCTLHTGLWKALNLI